MMELIKKIISITLVITHLVMLYGVVPARAENPVATNFVCGQDLNGNGYLGDEGEYQTCRISTIKHTIPATNFCLPGYTMQPNGNCMKYEYAPLGSQCPAGYFIQNGRCLHEQYLQPTAYCPAGYVPAGGGCQKYTWTPAAQSCPAGSFVQNGRCISQYDIAPTPQCHSSMGYNAATQECGKAERYMNGGGVGGWEIKRIETVHGGRNDSYIFWYYPQYICSQGTMVNNRCVINNDNGPVYLSCNWGYVLESGACKLTESTGYSYLCNVGTFTNGTCKVVTDGGAVQAVCNPGYIIQNGQCVKSTPSPTQYSCSQGSLSGTECLWDTKENYCPIGVDQACLNNNGGTSCSPNKCIDITTNKPVDEGNIDGSMLVDDGKKSEDGVCMDQLFIFSGRAQDCKLAGVDTAFKNCCKNEGKVFTDSAGAIGAVSNTAGAVSKLYTAAQEAYTYYSVAMTATGDVAVASSMAAQGFSQAMVAMFNPATIAVAVVMYFAMEYLMKACDQTSMETAMSAGSGYCHEVGSYCKKKIPLLGCVQKAKSYCCFNSKLARIIHEQGRPQLQNFNGWGEAGSPQCRGFSPDEFQSLDFSKIDLSEYVEDMVKKATDEIQSNVNQITQEFYEKTN